MKNPRLNPDNTALDAARLFPDDEAIRASAERIIGNRQREAEAEAAARAEANRKPPTIDQGQIGPDPSLIRPTASEWMEGLRRGVLDERYLRKMDRWLSG